MNKVKILTLLITSFSFNLYAQQAVKETKKIIKSSTENIQITDNENVKMDWRLEPNAKPDIYYVNVPSKRSRIQFKTDQDQYIIQTKPEKDYDFIILLNEKDSCHIRVSSKLPQGLPKLEISSKDRSNTAQSSHSTRIPFKLIGSRIYFDGKVNNKEVQIQFDLGAGTGVVNKNSSNKLDLLFTSHTMVSNTQGLNQARTSEKNQLTINGIALGNETPEFTWNDISLTEVGNMQTHEDLIIGNTFFRNSIIEIDYDKKEFILHPKLPKYIKTYQKSPVYYVQHRPIFKASIVHNNKQYDSWFLFDTGREGTMLIGNDFTSMNNNWVELQPLTFVNGRKIVRLNAIIAGVTFNDIVTNASDPTQANGKQTLLGNQLLNQFNVILDNPNGMLYLKPNSLMGGSYSDYEKYLKEAGTKN